MDLYENDIVPYVNSRGNVAKVKISTFTRFPPSEVIWLIGEDQETLAKVTFPVARSKELMQIGWILGEPPFERYKAKPVKSKRQQKLDKKNEESGGI